MNKYIYLILFVLSWSLVCASDKQILSVPYCYNVSVDCDLMQGNYTPLTFKDCSKVNGVFTCDCKDKRTFNLTMQTDSRALEYKDWRYYKCSISYNTYTLDRSNGDVLIVDTGSGWNIKSNGIEYQGQNTIEVHDVVYQDRLVQINHTEYIDKPIYIEHNNTLYFENTSRLDGCVVKLNDSNFKIDNLTSKNLGLDKSNKLFKTLFIICVIIIVYGSFWIVTNRRRKP